MSGHAILQLDLGNSRLKWRLIGGDAGSGAEAVLGRGACAPTDEAWLAQPATVVGVQVASVASEVTEAALAGRVRDRFAVEPWFARATARSGDLVNSYADPQRMGVDRWLAMAAARARCRERLCVVDAGSALTIDLVAADGRHEGGYIIPGAALMARALLADTDRVRFEAGAADSLAPGCSTADCVHRGIALAQAGALQLALAEAAAGGETPIVIASGGGGEALLALTPGTRAEYRQDLVFEGLALAARIA
ncbi:type III pantothenate kinase [Pseudohaliea sp.]|uniref:type III pantothenate kinase n=1 Tax=Pseudohaliea sp. TaxID=2740289 RepID=UPI0032EB8725